MRNVIEKEAPYASESDIRAMGICADCVDRALCTGRRNWVGPVFFCEEYRNQVGVPTRQAALRPVADPVESPVTRASTLKGLCVNCERRDDCCFTKPEGGVWHCEEYE